MVQKNRIMKGRKTSLLNSKKKAKKEVMILFMTPLEIATPSLRFVLLIGKVDIW